MTYRLRVWNKYNFDTRNANVLHVYLTNASFSYVVRAITHALHPALHCTLMRNGAFLILLPMKQRPKIVQYNHLWWNKEYHTHNIVCLQFSMFILNNTCIINTIYLYTFAFGADFFFFVLSSVLFSCFFTSVDVRNSNRWILSLWVLSVFWFFKFDWEKLVLALTVRKRNRPSHQNGLTTYPANTHSSGSGSEG